MGSALPDPQRAVGRVRGARGDREIGVFVEDVLAQLGARERRIVEARMIAGDPITLEELGEEMGASRERVKQLELRGRTALLSAVSEFRTAA